MQTLNLKHWKSFKKGESGCSVDSRNHLACFWTAIFVLPVESSQTFWVQYLKIKESFFTAAAILQWFSASTEAQQRGREQIFWCWQDWGKLNDVMHRRNVQELLTKRSELLYIWKTHIFFSHVSVFHAWEQQRVGQRGETVNVTAAAQVPFTHSAFDLQLLKGLQIRVWLLRAD